MRPLLNTVNESQSIENKRDAVLSCLIEYLGEPQEEVFQDSQLVYVCVTMLRRDCAKSQGAVGLSGMLLVPPHRCGHFGH
ncbi:hypothetical protein HF521_011777 [Silurus meridionalis]|uniref:Uncharacterized protein n=1 Tax=Silurus meridionalis TaxID=175797 RepID=A0A8T0AER9_SILME|nr:hypothetical protein HF521_011777 [Silurus meridionalis]